MSVARLYLGGALAVAKRDLMIFISYRTIFLSQIFQAVFAVTLFYYVSRLLRVGTFGSADEYFAFVVVGLVVLRVLIATVDQLPRAIRQELVAGTFERMLVSPLGAIGGVVGMMLFPFLSSVVVGAMMVLFATAAFGLPLEWHTAALSLPVALLATLAFAPLALLVGAAVLAVKQATGATPAIIALLTLVGGFYFPVTILPDWIEWTSEVQPITPALELMRHLLVGTPLTDPAWLQVLKLAGFWVVLSLLSYPVLRAALEWSQRRGTIIEY